MPIATWSSADSERAQRLWDEYAAQHDVSDRKGQAAGVDPESGRIWFGESASDIVAQIDAAGEFTPLYFIRVGYDTYLRKGGRH